MWFFSSESGHRGKSSFDRSHPFVSIELPSTYKNWKTEKKRREQIRRENSGRGEKEEYIHGDRDGKHYGLHRQQLQGVCNTSQLVGKMEGWP